jgi:phospholipid/cholesterol/gamma-HCH transport system substrate-binding protein
LIMSRIERREYLVGVLAALVLVAVLLFTASANRRALDTADGVFSLTAEFARVDGIYVGSPVRLAGIPVGLVAKTSLNGADRAMLTLRFNQPLPLPEDTAAVIETDGVFGSKHIELRPGGADEVLAPGGRISFTQESVIIEDLIARIVDEAKAARAVQDSKDAARAAARTRTPGPPP